MRAGAKASRRKLPKTWESTHGAKKDDATSTKSTARGIRGGWGRSTNTNFPQWKKTPAQKAKEAEREELERYLETYSYKTPAGPPHLPGSGFLNPLCKPSSSSQTLDQPLLPDGTTSRGSNPRLKAPMIAYTADYDEAADLLSCLGPGPMGLDLEWNVSTTGMNRTALLQICSSSLILIIHTSAMSHRIPPLLKSILQDANIIKTGVAIKNDALKLQRDYDIDTRNVLELGNLAKLAQPRKWAGINHLISLRDLTRIYLGRKLRKDGVRVSDWEKYPLSAEQIEYAASDTFVSLEVLRAIAEYFKPSVPDDTGLLDKMDQMLNGDTNRTMELEQALKASAYDLHEEKMQQQALAKQRQNWRPALRQIQAPAPPPPRSGAAVKLFQAKTAPTAPTKNRGRSSSPTNESDDDFVTVTRANLAHDRAMNRWLYSQRTLAQVASGSNIKVNTAAGYVLRALLEARSAAAGKDGGERGLLDDFTQADKRRLENELKAAGAQSVVFLKRYRALAKGLSWHEVGASPSGSEDEEAKRTVSPSVQKRQTAVQKNKSVGEKWSSPSHVVEVSDDEIEVIDTSR